MTQADEDMAGARRIHCEASPCQPQQVDVVASPFCFSPLQDNSNGNSGVLVIIPAIDRYLLHRRLHFPRTSTDGRTHSHFTNKIILPDSLRYRHLSETRAVVCLILGPVFVLWQEGYSEEGMAGIFMFVCTDD